MMESTQSAQHRSGHDPLVWYAGYGSNTDLGRLMCYIAGGTPTGTDRMYLGCKDTSPPIAHRALEIPYQLYFAGESRVWTGGVAFIGHDANETTVATYASIYLIKLSQLEQLVAQENGRETAYPIDLQSLPKSGILRVGEGTGRYDGILYCGTQDDIPIVAITTPVPHTIFNKPSPAYLHIIASSLRGNVHRLTMDELVDYLLQKPGIAGNYSEAELRQVIA